MIVREWRGRATASNTAAYRKHFRENVLADLRDVQGFAGASLCERELDGEVEFLVLTRWTSMDAIRGFAGDDVGRAVVEPEARAALDSFDDHVSHYEVIEETK